MLDVLVTTGRLVTPQGAAAWGVAARGEPIVTRQVDEVRFTLGPEDDLRA